MEILKEVYSLEVILYILGICGLFTLFAYLIMRSNNKRAKEMKLKSGDNVRFSTVNGSKKGKVIEDGEQVKIEVLVPRHLVYKDEE
jgi:preprotein translocase subunit YajC